MTQQILSPNSLAPNDKLGDTPFDYTGKINNNFTELFDANSNLGFTYISKEGDFPLQDSTTITLETNVNYFLTTFVTTAKNFIVQEGAFLTAHNVNKLTLEYTGTGVMFTSVDVSFGFSNLLLDAPNATQGFACSDSTGNTKGLDLINVTFVSLAKYGTFTAFQALVVERCGIFSSSGEGGMTINGSGWTILQITSFAIIGTSPSFISIDLNTSVHTFLDLEKIIAIAPAGAIGIKGAANSANMVSGLIGVINSSNFSGGMTIYLSGLTADDVRYAFRSNSNIPDTNPDCLISLTGNTAETVISTQSVPVLLNGVWNAVERESHFTSTTGGRSTYNGERSIAEPVTISVTVEPVSGNNKIVSAYVAVDGVFQANSKVTLTVDNATPRTISIPWQVEFIENRFVEIYLSNDSDTVNIIAASAILRIR